MGTIEKENCSIPKTENEITEEWISKAVGMTPVPNSVSAVGNIQAGVGFLSNLCRISFQTEGGVDQNILVKLLPENPEFRALTLAEKFDEREVQFYSIVEPKIAEVAPKIRDNLVKVYCGKTSKSENGNSDENYASMLVMEDLKPLGYKMLNPESDKWEENLEKVIRFLAQFHCAGAALEKSTNSKIAEIFPFCMGATESKHDLLMVMVRTNMPILDEFLEKRNSSEEIRAAYREIGERVEEIFAITLAEGAKNACLIHGDVWPPNIMIVEGCDNSPVKIIDWQLLGLRDPTFEITVAILTSLPKAQLKRESIDKLCKIYLEECDALGCDLGRGKAEFLEFFNTWGMVYAFYWNLLSFDSFPEDMERLLLEFELLQREYKIADFLKDYCKKQ